MDSVLTLVLLPIALGIVMLGLGLSLTLDDFRRVLVYPKAVIIALACQLILLPLVCFGLVLAFQLPPALAVGMMLLAAAPGGPTANIYSHLFGGNVALNVTLTAVNSVLAAVTLPVVVNLSTNYFLTDGNSVGLQFDKVVQVFAIVLIPVAVGMLVRAKASSFAARMHGPVRIISIVVLVLVITGAILKERANLAGFFVSVGLIVLVFNVVSLAVGFYAPRLAGVGRAESIAASMEIGIHSAALSITVAVSLLRNTEMAIPSAVYGILMFFTAAAFGFLLNRTRPAAKTPTEAPAAS